MICSTCGPTTNAPSATVAALCAAWLLAGREIPHGMWVLHKCDVPICVNVDHLYLGTPQDNSNDMARRWRGTKSRRGLPFGVHRSRSRFCAAIKFEGRRITLGSYDTPEEATTVALAAKLERRYQ